VNRTRLALVVHFHQPVGNLDSVVRAATDNCYRPFLEVLDSHPEIRLTLHYSGCLLEWLEANASDVSQRLISLSSSGRVELMTGGFYEPILAALPARDRVGQIAMMSRHLNDRYRAEPTGLWLTERVWEQDVVSSLGEAGIAYTVVDDTIFHSVGIADKELVGPFVTDHDPKPLLLYAGDRNLRYLIPYKRVERVTEYLQSFEPGRLFVYADDGEKFGEWPDTYERVYEKKWLHRFFEELTAQSEWLELVTLGEHARSARPVGRVYLPSSSYDEMMTWALPTEGRLTVGRARRSLRKDDPEGLLPFVRGAPWRAFLAKYPEVNHLQKRMLDVSGAVGSAGDPEEARRELYRAQCNCAYWHGAFGGVFLGFMRTALWHHLMRSESIARAEAAGSNVRVVDFDADTQNEIIITAPWGAAVVAPSRGGRLIELDDWRVGANLLATMARHREAYHVADENPIEESDDDEMAAVQPRPEIDRDALVFDEGGRGGLIDILDGARIDRPYDYRVGDGGLVVTSAEVDGVLIEKTFGADAVELLVAYTITNNAGSRIVEEFATETSVLPLNLGRDVAPDNVDADEHRWRISQPEGEVGLEVTFSRAADVTWEPIETASSSLEGLQLLRQGTAVTTTWPLELEPGESFSIELRLRPVVDEIALGKHEKGLSA
jgi:hypothetical protein